jgi:hypothetical protein
LRAAVRYVAGSVFELHVHLGPKDVLPVELDEVIEKFGRGFRLPRVHSSPPGLVYFQSECQNPPRPKARPRATFLARLATRRGFPEAIADVYEVALGRPTSSPALSLARRRRVAAIQRARRRPISAGSRS